VDDELDVGIYAECGDGCVLVGGIGLEYADSKGSAGVAQDADERCARVGFCWDGSVPVDDEIAVRYSRADWSGGLLGARMEAGEKYEGEE